jgi:hypothetical protein
MNRQRMEELAREQQVRSQQYLAQQTGPPEFPGFPQPGDAVSPPVRCCRIFIAYANTDDHARLLSLAIRTTLRQQQVSLMTSTCSARLSGR